MKTKKIVGFILIGAPVLLLFAIDVAIRGWGEFFSILAGVFIAGVIITGIELVARS